MKCAHCGSELDPGAAFCGNCGTPVGQVAPPVAPTATPNVSNPASPTPSQPSSTTPAPAPAYAGKRAYPAGGGAAIASLVISILGLVGWLIPALGMVMGVVGLILGTFSTKSRHRSLAITGIVISIIVIGLSIFGWVYVYQHPE